MDDSCEVGVLVVSRRGDRRCSTAREDEHIPSLGRMKGVHPDEYALSEVVVGFAQI